MNIEVYEKKRKDSLWAKKKKDAEKDPNLDEDKEAPKEEMKKTQVLINEFHRKLDKAGYFNSKSMDESKVLYGKFKQLELKLLPESLRSVVKHRLEYLKLMASLSQKQNLRDLMDSFEPKVASLGIFGVDKDKLDKMAKESKEFQKLKEDDINFAIQKLRITSRHLKPLTNMGNFGAKANKYIKIPGMHIQGKRVDDGYACKKLRDGIQILRKNLARLYRTKKVLNKKEAPEVASKGKKRAA